MKTLLLLTCGTNACYHIARLLKTKFSDNIRVVGADINKQWMIPTSPFLDAFYQSPYSCDPSYYHFILNVCKQEKVDYLFPSFDTDQFLFYKENPDLKAINVKSFAITQKIKEIYNSKEKMALYMESIGIPVPRMYSLDQLNEDDLYFVKPQNGVGSKGAHVASGNQIINSKADDLLIQEICHEPEYTLECFNFKGKIYSIARQRLENKAGVCTKARIFHDEELTAIAQRFADNTSLPYIFNLQFMKNENNSYVVTDVNLRTAGGMSLSYAVGWDEVSALIGIIKGESDEKIVQYVQPIEQETYVVRAYTDIVTKQVKQCIAFDLDGTLLDSKKRHQIVMDDVLSKYGLTLNTDDLVLYKSNGFNNISWLENKGVDGELAHEIQKEWISNIERDDYLKLDLLYDGILDYLKMLSKQNKLYLLTSRNNVPGTLSQIKNLGLDQYFDKIEIVRSANATFDKIQFLVNNHVDIMVGDTEIDYQAACNAKCNFLVAIDGFRSLSFWSKYNVKHWHKEDIL